MIARDFCRGYWYANKKNVGAGSPASGTYILFDGDLGVEQAHETVLRAGEHEGPLVGVEPHL